MIISELGYLEVVSEGTSVMGGATKTRVNKTKVNQKAIAIGSPSITQDVSVVTSNDNLQLGVAPDIKLKDNYFA